MNISKFTQKSLQAVQNLEKTAYDFGNQEIESASSGRQSDLKDDRKDGD